MLNVTPTYLHWHKFFQLHRERFDKNNLIKALNGTIVQLPQKSKHFKMKSYHILPFKILQ